MFRKYQSIVIAFLIVTAATLFVMKYMGDMTAAVRPDDSLRLDARGNVIFRLEFAKDYSTMQGTVDLYSSSIEILRRNTLMDFVFIFCYSLCFVIALAVLRANHDRFMAKWYWLIVLCLPGILDVIENLFILHYLDGGEGKYFNWYYGIVRAKWISAILFFPIPVLALVRLFLLLIRRITGALSKQVA